jgi:hypothetical protein
MAALILDSPTNKSSTNNTVSFRGPNKLVELSFRNVNRDDSDVFEEEQEPEEQASNVDSTIFALTLSEDVDVCEPEPPSTVVEDCDDDWDDDESFVTAPGTPEDEEWKKARPSFYINGFEFGQEDAQVFIALKDGGFWSRPGTEAEFPMVHDWFFRVVSKFTLRQIEERSVRTVITKIYSSKAFRLKFIFFFSTNSAIRELFKEN